MSHLNFISNEWANNTILLCWLKLLLAYLIWYFNIFFIYTEVTRKFNVQELKTISTPIFPLIKGFVFSQ